VKAALTHPKAAGLSDREIARHVGVSHCVGDWRETIVPTVKVSQSNRTGADGRTINTTNIGRPLLIFIGAPQAVGLVGAETIPLSVFPAALVDRSGTAGH
jgi:hypothetical protein